MKSQEDDDESQYFMYIGLGFAFSSLGSTYIVVDGIPEIASFGFFGGAILFFIAGVLKYRENETPDDNSPE